MLHKYCLLVTTIKAWPQRQLFENIYIRYEHEVKINIPIDTEVIFTLGIIGAREDGEDIFNILLTLLGDSPLELEKEHNS